MLFQLHEPGQTPKAPQDTSSIVLGIDLGTTHSVVAIAKNQTPYTLKIDGHPLVPSIMADVGEIKIGRSAMPFLSTHPEHIARSTKRLLAKSVEDKDPILSQFHLVTDNNTQGLVHFKVGNRVYNPIQVAAEILKYIKDKTCLHFERDINQAVITVPAYFNDNARNATRLAAQMAGFDVLRLISEPTAAAIAYGLDKENHGCIAVYDLGGGTFDISILRLQQGILQVIATGGDASLGGDDFDHAIADHMQQMCKTAIKVPNAQKHLLTHARKIKEHLTQNNVYSGTIYGIPYSIDRLTFDRITQPLRDQTIETISSVMHDAHLKIEDINAVVLVGGATRIPSIYNAVEKKFQRSPLTTLNPDEVVALGAALQAENLTTGGKSLLLDVTPLSLGLETMGNIVEKIILRNTPIPCRIAQTFTTHQDNQTAMRIHIVQGEREFMQDCRSLGYFSLKNIPPMPAGMAKIQVTFLVDADGLLTVKATEMNTGYAQHIDIKPSYGLTEKKIQTMLEESYQHGAHDLNKRLLIRSQEKLNQTITALQSGLEDDAHLIDEATKKHLKDLVDKASKVSQKKEHLDALQQEISEASQEFAQLRLEKALSSKKIDSTGHTLNREK